MTFFNFLREDSPFSTMRVAVFFTTACFVPAFTFAFVNTAYKTALIPDIPSGVTWLLGTLLGAKTMQKAVEVFADVIKGNRPATTDTPPATPPTA